MLLQVTHDTRYRYMPVVETAQHMAYMRPRAHAAQDVLDHLLLINPQPAQMSNIADVYGNNRCFFSLQTPHEVLSVVAHSLVSTRASPIITASLNPRGSIPPRVLI